MYNYYYPRAEIQQNEAMPYAQAYVPIQPLTVLFPPEEALHKGTVFPELYDPYCSPYENKC